MVVINTLVEDLRVFVNHLSLFLLVLFFWNRSCWLGCLSVLCLVCYYPLLSDYSRAGSVSGDMGCTPSSIEPLICEQHEEEFLSRWKRSTVDNSVGSHQSSSDISLFKIEEKAVINNGAGETCHPHWSSEIPEILGVIIVAILAFIWIRRWNRKQYMKQYKRAMGQSLRLQTVSSTVPMQGPMAPENAFKGWAGRSLD